MVFKDSGVLCCSIIISPERARRFLFFSISGLLPLILCALAETPAQNAADIDARELQCQQERARVREQQNIQQNGERRRQRGDQRLYQRQKQDGKGTVWSETTLDSGGTTSIKTGRDLALTGAQVSGNKVVGDVGRDLLKCATGTCWAWLCRTFTMSE